MFEELLAELEGRGGVTEFADDWRDVYDSLSDKELGILLMLIKKKTDEEEREIRGYCSGACPQRGCDIG